MWTTKILQVDAPALFRTGVVLFGVLIALLLAPGARAIPGEGVLRWLAGYGAVAIWLRAVWLEASAIRGWWGGVDPGRRSWGAAALAGLVIIGALLMREAAPDAFGTFSRENGLWEPL